MSRFYLHNLSQNSWGSHLTSGSSMCQKAVSSARIRSISFSQIRRNSGYWSWVARICQNNEKMTWCGTTLWHSFLKPRGKQNGLFLNQGDKPIWMLNLPMANPGSTMSPPNEPANGHVNQVQLSCYHFFESCMHQQVVSQVLSKSLPEHFSELISSRWGYAGYGHECVEWMLEILEVT